MSMYESEHGSYIIPSDQWAVFKAKLIGAYNRQQQTLLRRASALYEELKKRGEGKRKFDYREALFTIERAGSARHWSVRRSELEEAVADDDIGAAVLRGDKLVRPMPTKEPFKLATPRAASLPMPEATVAFDNATRTVRWGVMENNHAVDRAREHPFARDFFRALDAIVWKRGSGGFIEYRNENMRYEGGFGDAPRISNALGPVGTNEEKARSQALGTYLRAQRRPR